MNNRIRRMGLVAGPALFLAITLFAPIQGLSFEAKIVLALTIWMGTWWITEAIPIYVTALLPIAVLPSLGATDLGSTSASYADRVVFLFLGGFILAKAVEKSNLHRRFALNILKIFGTNPKYIVAAFMMVTGLLSGWMSNTATAMLMLPIAVAVVSHMQTSSQDKERFGLCLMLAVAYSASIGGMATLIGTPPNAIFASLSRSLLDTEVNFGQWLIVGLPISAVLLFTAWVYLVHIGVNIRGIKSIAGGKDLIAKKLSEVGQMTRDEKLVAVVFAATAIAWVTRGLIWQNALPMVDDSTIAILAAMAMFLIPSKVDGNPEEYDDNGKEQSGKNNGADGRRLMDWRTAVTIPWGVLLLIGGGLALANAYTATGLDEWIAERLAFLQGMSYLLIILVLVAVAIAAGEVISNTATAALLIPISVSLARSLEMDPILLMVPVTIACSFGFAMPAGTPPNAIAFASCYVTVPKMARAGLPLDIISIVMITGLTVLLVPAIWR